jgi:hypothetical protein
MEKFGEFRSISLHDKKENSLVFIDLEVIVRLKKRF